LETDRRTRPRRVAQYVPWAGKNVADAILICPSLQQRGDQDTRQTDGQAQKPERVDQDDRCRRGKLSGIDEGRRREEIAGLFDVGEQFGGFREIECPFVERV